MERGGIPVPGPAHARWDMGQRSERLLARRSSRPQPEQPRTAAVALGRRPMERDLARNREYAGRCAVHIDLGLGSKRCVRRLEVRDAPSQRDWLGTAPDAAHWWHGHERAV